MNQEKQAIGDEQALQNFLLDIKCLDELLPWTEKFNMFDVLKISRTEIRHSNMLGWLLDANENHGLGDDFLKGILQRIVENDEMGRYDIFKVLLLDFYSFRVLREWKNIDILLISDEEKIVIAIENKVSSHEHSNQLNRYREILEKDYSGYNRILIYLTPDGEEPSDMVNWDILTYRDVVEVLEEVHSVKKVHPDVDLMIRNYIDVIRRDIVEDEKLIEICNKIYNKHKKALDLIFDKRTDGRMQIADVICSTLKKLCEEGKIIYEDGFGCSFRTADIDKILPLIEDCKSSWGTDSIYSYWFEIRDGKFSGIFELGGLNVPDKSLKVMEGIANILKPKDKKKENFKYKRVYRTKWFDANDVEDIDDEVEEMVRNSVSEILKMQDELLEKMSCNDN